MSQTESVIELILAIGNLSPSKSKSTRSNFFIEKGMLLL